MKKLIDLIQEELVKAFTAAEMDPSYACLLYTSDAADE